MNSKLLRSYLRPSPIRSKLAVIAIVVAWGILYLGFLASRLFFPSERLVTTAGADSPVITLESASGGPGARVTVRGKGWPVGSRVSIYLTAPDEVEILDYPVATTITDVEGQWIARFVFPKGNQWESQGAATITAQTDDNRQPVQAIFKLESGPGQPAEYQ